MSTASAWAEYLQQARWFGGKGLAFEVVGIEPLPWYTPDGVWPAVRSEIATIAYADGSREQYHLLAGYVPVGSAPAGLAVDQHAGGRPRRCGLPGRAHPSAGHGADDQGTAGPPARRHGVDRPGPVDAEAPMRLYTGEQSNTTVIVGEATLLKLFRKLEPGRNLDAEVLGALSGSGITPDLYGVLSGGSRSDEFDLAMFCQRVLDVTDGWKYATAACAEDRDISAECRQLGVELRELHRLLAEAFGTWQRPGTDLAAAMQRRFTAAADQVSELAQYRNAAGLLFAAPSGRDLTTQRVHGDFHLGQVLHRTSGGSEWVIIDFEGEPLKTLAERRELDTVWRDVAGCPAEPRLRPERPSRTRRSDRPGLVRARHARRSWTATAAGRPRNPTLLRAYELDKAVYEVVYEVRNRPDWAHIPLQRSPR